MVKICVRLDLILFSIILASIRLIDYFCNKIKKNNKDDSKAQDTVIRG